MQQLGSALLAQTLGWARARAVALLQQELNALLATLAPGADPASLPGEVQADLDRAKRATLAMDPSRPEDAVTQLGLALDALHGACTKIESTIPAVGDAGAALARLVDPVAGAAGDAPTGLVGQMGLRRVGTWTVSGSELSGTFGNSGLVELADLVTLSSLRLIVRFDWRTRRLALTCTASVKLAVVADALVDALTGGATADVTTTVTVELDTEHGLTVGAGATSRSALSGAIDLDALDLHGLEFGASEDVPSAFEISATLAGKLIAFDVVIDRVGILFAIDPAAAIPLAARALEPLGAGVTVDAGIVRGGGTLEHRAGAYFGALELRVGPVAAKAIALVQTDPSFSLALLFFSEFDAPIELGFGFSLDGVGGLLALDRGVSSDRLLAGIHDGTADRLLFSSDLTKIDAGLLEAVFPAQRGRLAVGPAFKIAWGSPLALLIAKVGVVLVLPAPKIVLLGALRIAVPRPELPIVDLKASVFGEITPERILLVVGLSGSRIAGFTLSGDLGVLFRYGPEPMFASSAGGFHPGYAAPAELGSLRRIVVDMSPPAVLSLRAEAYVALTSNAFMLGARVEAEIDFVVASAHGWLGFDAIVLWAPFHFAIDIGAHVDISVAGESFAGVTLALHVEGPGRWIVHGRATLDLFFLPDLHLEVSKEWGTSADVAPAVVSPLALIRTELTEPNAWQALPPAAASQLVTMRDATPSAPDIRFAHPLGGLTVRQRAVPLGENVQQVGGHPVSEHVITLGVPTLGSAPADDVWDEFAPGEYFTLTDDEKLSRPAFVSYRAGKSIGGLRAASFGTPQQRDYRWETAYPNRPDLTAAEPQPYVFPSVLVPHLLASSPAGVLAATKYFLADRGQISVSAAS